MNLTVEPDLVDVPATHYVFVEKVGPFQTNAGQAWQQAHAFVPRLLEKNQIEGFLSLYKRGPQVYRAGFATAATPVDVPEGMAYERFEGGRYARFILTGPYSELPSASGRVWSLVEENRLKLRDGFAIERYMNDPRSTPEDQLVTYIEIPVE